jgi:hypothetical protein
MKPFACALCLAVSKSGTTPWAPDDVNGNRNNTTIAQTILVMAALMVHLLSASFNRSLQALSSFATAHG